jgi:hypothetical protein
MSHARHTGRKDSNHRAIVEQLQAWGYVTFDTSGLRNLGFDLVVYDRPRTQKFLIFEIKSGNKPLTPSEEKARRLAPIPTVQTAREVSDAFGNPI